MGPPLESVWLAASAARSMPVFLDCAGKSVVLLLLAATTVLVLRHRSASTRHLVLVSAMVGLLGVPALSLSLPDWRVLPGSSRASVPVVTNGLPGGSFRAAPSARPTGNAVGSGIQGGKRRPLIDPPSAPLEEAAEPAAPSTPSLVSQVASRHRVGGSAVPWMICVWAIGTAVLLARLVLCTFFLSSLARGSDHVTEGRIHGILQSVRGEMGIRRSVALLLSHRRDMPMTWGIFAPRLLLPAEACGWDESELRPVLLHELGHIKRWDALSQWIVQLTCAVYWLNPMIWLAARRIRVESERACDDLVLSYGVNAADYAEQLLRMVSGYARRPFAGSAAVAMATGYKLEERVMILLNRAICRSGTSRLAVLLCLLSTSTIVVPVAMVQSAQPTVVARLRVSRGPSSEVTRSSLRVSRKPKYAAARSTVEQATFMATQVDLIASPIVVNSVLRRPGIQELPIVKGSAEPLEWLRNELTVRQVPNSEIIEIRMTGHEAEQMVALVDAVIDAYLMEIVQTEPDEQTKMLDTLNQTLLRNRLDYEQKKARFQELADESLVAPDDEAVELAQRMVMQDLSELGRKKERVEKEFRMAISQYDTARAAIQSGRRNPSDFMIDNELEMDYEYFVAKQQLKQLEDQYEYYSRIARPGSASLRRLGTQILVAKRELEKLREEKKPRIIARIRRRIGPDDLSSEPILQHLGAKIKSLQADVGYLQKEYDKKREEFSALSKASVKLLTMKRELEQLEEFIGEAEVRANELNVNLSRPPRVTILHKAQVEP